MTKSIPKIGEQIYVGGWNTAVRVVKAHSRGAIEVHYVLEEDGTKSWTVLPDEHSDVGIRTAWVIPPARESFFDLSPLEQVNVLFKYTNYVTAYPDDHDQGSYPVCFWEWYEDDYQEYGG